MDRRQAGRGGRRALIGRAARYRTAACLIAAGVGWTAASAEQPPPLTDLKWLAAGADPVAAVTTQPAECLGPPADADRRFAVEVGRAAFRNPLLLGGPAARSGLSCQTCHLNGRDNPHFFLHGVSGHPGTADATSALFSKTRGDGLLNPVAIPSLLDVADKQVFGQAGAVASLDAFVTGVIVDEFQGAEPPPAVFDGLIAYLGALRSDACPAHDDQAIRFAGDMADIRRTVDTLDAALDRDDPALADFLLLAVRGQLGRVHERFARPELEAERLELADLARDLGELRRLMALDGAAARERLRAWRVRLDVASHTLAPAAERSYYDADVLRRLLHATR